MKLYPNYETEISFKYLKEVVNILDEPICILGGWAVYFTVNEKIKADSGMGYIGSKDIDLGFHIDKNITDETLKKLPIAKTITLLEKNGFKPLSFRYYKDIGIETGEELTKEQSAMKLIHDIFQIYVDLIVDEIHPKFKKTFGLDPIDESLLKHVFEEKTNRIELKEFEKMLWLPTTEILLATKIKSLPNRTKDNKKIKDLCDIYSLGWYSGKNIDQLKEAVSHFNTKKERDDVLKCIKTEEYLVDSCQQATGVEKETIKNLILELLKEF
jgi:hypothetical protein